MTTETQQGKTQEVPKFSPECRYAVTQAKDGAFLVWDDPRTPFAKCDTAEEAINYLLDDQKRDKLRVEYLAWVGHMAEELGKTREDINDIVHDYGRMWEGAVPQFHTA